MNAPITLADIARRARPGREEMIRQAVLNAMRAEMPCTTGIKGVEFMCHYILAQPTRLGVAGPIPIQWLNVIRREFRALAEKHEVAA